MKTYNLNNDAELADYHIHMTKVEKYLLTHDGVVNILVKKSILNPRNAIRLIQEIVLTYAGIVMDFSTEELELSVSKRGSKLALETLASKMEIDGKDPITYLSDPKEIIEEMEKLCKQLNVDFTPQMRAGLETSIARELETLKNKKAGNITLEEVLAKLNKKNNL